MLVCGDGAEAATALRDRDPRYLRNSVQETSERPVAFMFSGAGEQYIGMGRGLYDSEPVFREQVDLCSEMIKPQLGLDLREVIYPRGNHEASGNGGFDLRRMLRPDTHVDEASQKLNQTLLAQAALFVIEYALVQLWQSCGIKPQAMIGYSIGEYVAACVAGVFSLEDALKLVIRRAQLIQTLPSGSMVSVPLPVDEVYPPWVRSCRSQQPLARS